MAALDFPSSPTLNQIYSANGKAWIWDGVVWNAYSGVGGNSITTSATPPLNPSNGDLWFNTENGLVYVYYVDANSQQWVAPDNSGGSSSGATKLLASLTSSIRGTTTIDCPIDGTIPQVSEMTAYPSLDVTVTPANASSTIIVEYEVFVASSTLGSAPLAIFKDSNTSASTATYVTIQNTDYGLTCRVRLIETAGSGARTYKLYFARQSGGSGNRYIGRSDSQATLFSTAMINTVTVFECLPL